MANQSSSRDPAAQVLAGVFFVHQPTNSITSLADSYNLSVFGRIQRERLAELESRTLGRARADLGPT